MAVHELSRSDARRIAVRAQLLDANRPTDLLDTIRHLSSLQLDLTSYVAPNADLVAWSRLGSSYDPAELADLLDTQTVLELQGRIRPAEDLALYRAEMAEWPGRSEPGDWHEAQADWVRANNACRLEILERLRGDGPLPVAELPDTCELPWRSSGWNNKRNRMQLVKLMARRGEIAVSGRDGREQLWDLAERVYPDEPVIPSDEALRRRTERQLRALGITRPRTPTASDEPFELITGGEPAVIDGLRGEWRVDPTLLGGTFRGRPALLSPLDRLVFDRKRMSELFDFDYQLEMYKPAAQRRWGYWALPILYGDRLVGKLDAAADRAQRVLRVDAIHRDVEFSPAMTAAVDREVAELADWLGLDLLLPE